MKRLQETLKNIWSIKELRDKILVTLLLLFVYRLGSHIVLPGISNINDLSTSNNSGLLGLLNSFVGGAFNRASIFALGVMPYISASIAIQLLGFALPSFQKMQKEESGRKKMTQYTRYLTVIVTLFQSIGYIAYLKGDLGVILSPGVSDALFAVSTVIILTAGTVFVMWLGEKITEEGIGNGVSILIMVGIIARFPSVLISEWTNQSKAGGILIFLLEMTFLVVVIMAIIMLVQAVRRIPVDYARQLAGSRKRTTTAGASRQYIPLKVNAVGVMPIIFAQAILFIPPTAMRLYDETSPLIQTLSSPASTAYNVMYFVMVLLFTYFYTALTFNPTSMADDLKRSNAFIPGVKPGQDTANYIAGIMDRITLPGAIFLGFIGILPGLLMAVGMNGDLASFFGGTSMLIMVAVIIDTLQQIESYLLMQKYDGLMDGMEIQSRQSSPVSLPQY